MTVAEHPEWAIRCPWCETPAGQRCTTRRGRQLTIPSHYARIQAWTDRTTQDQKTGAPK